MLDVTYFSVGLMGELDPLVARASGIGCYLLAPIAGAHIGFWRAFGWIVMASVQI